MNENIESNIDTVDVIRSPDSILRISVRSMYDLQTLRIQNGNRICAAFRVKLGLESSQSEEDDKKAKRLLDDLRAEFKRVTDGVKRITKGFKSDSYLITTRSELALLESYERSLEAEQIHEKAIAYELSFEPIWTEYLEGVRGVGPLMAGVIVSEVDIHKCNSISALWAYCGLDVVTVTDKITGEVRTEGRSRQAQHLVDKVYTTRDGEEKHTKGISFNPLFKTKMVGVLGGVFLKMGGEYKAIYDGYKHRLENHPEHRDSWSIVRYTTIPSKDSKTGKATSVDKIHEVIVKYYTEEEGKLAWSGYEAKYSPDPAAYKLKRTGKTKGHRHNMAVRYMVKEFLADLWTKWRTLEGLPVRSTYAEEKLGIIHSKTREHSWSRETVTDIEEN